MPQVTVNRLNGLLVTQTMVKCITVCQPHPHLPPPPTYTKKRKEKKSRSKEMSPDFRPGMLPLVPFLWLWPAL